MTGYPNLTPREDIAVADEDAAVRDVAAVEATTMDLISTTQLMAGSMECTAQTSGGVYTENNLTWPGAMGTCMFLTSARVIRTPVISKRFSTAGIMMGRI